MAKENPQASWKLEPAKRTRILKGEEVKTGRNFTRALRLIRGAEVQYRAASFYAYIRGVEDVVDQGIDSLYARKLVSQEADYVEALINGATHPDERLYEGRTFLADGLRGIKPESPKGQSLLTSTHEMLTGIRIDNEAIAQGEPLSADILWTRNLFESMSGFQVLSQLVFDRELEGKGKPSVEELFNRWIEYDALRDLDEDLSAGLSLFPQSTLNEYGIRLQRGLPIPGEVRDLFEDQKIVVGERLTKLAPAIHETSLPRPYKTALHGYFRSRVPKLKHTAYPVANTTRFGQNSTILSSS